MKTLNCVLNDKNNFDAIRLFAAVGVIFSHAYGIVDGSKKSEFFYILSGGQSTFGDLCVAVFFIVSGLLITQSFTRSTSIVGYFTNRVLRIIPALFVVSLMICVVIGPIVTKSSSREYWTNYLTIRYMGNALIYPAAQELPGVFVSNIYSSITNASIWTLSYEFTCYILIAAVCSIFKKSWIISTILFTIAMATVFYTYISPEIFLKFASYFFAGSIAFWARNSFILDFRVFLISFATLGGAIFLHHGLVPALCIFGTYAIVYIAYAEKLKLQGISRHGDFSYGVYLWAWPIQQLVAPYSSTAAENFLYSTPIVFILAFLSWNFVEKPVLSKKKVVAKYIQSVGKMLHT